MGVMKGVSVLGVRVGRPMCGEVKGVSMWG